MFNLVNVLMLAVSGWRFVQYLHFPRIAIPHTHSHMWVSVCVMFAMSNHLSISCRWHLLNSTICQMLLWIPGTYSLIQYSEQGGYKFYLCPKMKKQSAGQWSDPFKVTGSVGGGDSDPDLWHGDFMETLTRDFMIIVRYFFDQRLWVFMHQCSCEFFFYFKKRRNFEIVK